MWNMLEIGIPLLFAALFLTAALSIILSARREQKRAKRERKHRELIKRIKEEKLRMEAEKRKESEEQR